MEVLQENNQYVIKIPMADIDASGLDKLLRQIRLRELLAQRQGTDEDATLLAQGVNQDWWQANKQRFLP
jgi:hypothetical protein